jgi:hypothetical protein
MSFKEYTLIEPEPESPISVVLRNMALFEPYKASRLVSALEEFVWNGVDVGYRVSPEESGGKTEVYIVPQKLLFGIPDASALLLVDHAYSRIEIISVIELFSGPGESEQWREIKRLSDKALGAL